MIVACVLRSCGPDYGPGNVEALRDNLARHSDARLVCLSDVDVPCERVPLVHDWPGWWSKVELFRFSYPEPVLYVDLDTVFLSDPAPLFRERFTMLARLNQPGDVGSGIMSWSGDYSQVYRRFAASPGRFVAEYKTTPKCGDQGFIRDTIGLPNIDTYRVSDCASYKGHCTSMGKRPFRMPEPRPIVVYFHGRPRPWEVPPIPGA
jgi:hypothetical protein